MLASFMR